MPEHKTTKVLFLFFIILSLSACSIGIGSGRLYTSPGVSLEGVKSIFGKHYDDIDEMAEQEQIEDIDALIADIFDGDPNSFQEATAVRSVCKSGDAKKQALSRSSTDDEDAEKQALSRSSTETRTCYRNELQNLILGRSERELYT